MTYRRVALVTSITLGASAVVLGVVLVSYVAWTRGRIARIEGAFARVKIGDSPEHVRHVMGDPGEIRKGDVMFSAQAGVTDDFEAIDAERCSEQFVYYLETPYLAHVWVVGLNRQKVVAKFRLD